MLQGNRTPLNSVWWSLQWEAWFSLLLPVVVLLCRPLRRHLWVFGLACLFLACWGRTQRHVYPPDVWYYALEFLPMFGIGVALAAYEPAIRRLRCFRNPAVGWLTVFLALAF